MIRGTLVHGLAGLFACRSSVAAHTCRASPIDERRIHADCLQALASIQAHASSAIAECESDHSLSWKPGADPELAFHKMNLNFS